MNRNSGVPTSLRSLPGTVRGYRAHQLYDIAPPASMATLTALQDRGQDRRAGTSVKHAETRTPLVLRVKNIET